MRKHPGHLELWLFSASHPLTLLLSVTSHKDIICGSGILGKVWCFGRFAFLMPRRRSMLCRSVDPVMLSPLDMAQDICKYATTDKVAKKHFTNSWGPLA